jgi:Flp pilus assembly protein TadG
MHAPRTIRRLWTDERGAATAELVLAVPLLLLLLLLIAQFTLWLHATHIAQAAASEALSATRVEGGTVAHGQAEANRVLRQLGDGPLHSPSATVTRGPEEASVHVEGTVTAVVPFLTLTAAGDATGPIERFVPQSR